MKTIKILAIIISAQNLFSTLCHAAIANYTNDLSSIQTVDQDFDDYSAIASQMMGYGAGCFTITNNRLEFTTLNSWAGIKTLKTTIGLNDNWTASISFHLNKIQNIVEGHYYDTGIVLAYGNDFNTAFPNRIVFKALQSFEGRIIRATLYTGGVEQKSFSNTSVLLNATDGILKFVYYPEYRSVMCYFTIMGDPTSYSLCEFKIDNANNQNNELGYNAWNCSANANLNISIFAGSEPYGQLTYFPAITSGDIFLSNFSLNNKAEKWQYVIEDGNARITGYRGPGGSVTIPAAIDNINVTKVGNGYFKPIFLSQNLTLYNNDITNIKVSEGINTIVDCAFAGCLILESVTYPLSLRNIKDWTHAGNISLKNVSFSPGINQIGEMVFANCYAIQSIFIPETVSKVGFSIFKDCTNMTSIYFLGDKPEITGSQWDLSGENVGNIYILPDAAGWGSTFINRPVNRLTGLQAYYLGRQSILTNPFVNNLYNSDQMSNNFLLGQQTILAQPNQFSLYTTNQMQAMAMGNLVLNKNTNGTFTLNYDIEQSTDLQTWTPYQALSLPLTGLPANKAFVRIKLKNSQ